MFLMKDDLVGYPNAACQKETNCVVLMTSTAGDADGFSGLKIDKSTIHNLVVFKHYKVIKNKLNLFCRVYYFVSEINKGTNRQQRAVYIWKDVRDNLMSGR
jgi:hypothetical protein